MRKAKGINERLIIKNFLSINFLDWEIKEFNVLTGGIAVGKSLCIKLAYFFEGILDDVITFSDRDTFTKRAFYACIAEEFDRIFYSEVPEHDYCNTDIQYTFKIKEGRQFDLSVKWDARSKKLKWKSKYIDTHIEKWHNKVKNRKFNSAVSSMILKSVRVEFHNCFPISPMLLPAVRAINSITDTEIFNGKFILDNAVREFVFNVKYVNYSMTIEKSLKEINDVLRPYKLSLIKKLNKVTQGYDLKYITTDKSKREVRPLEMSSGQLFPFYRRAVYTSVSPGTKEHHRIHCEYF